MSHFNIGYFHDEAAAFAKLESVLWPGGPVCPHCRSTKKVYVLANTRIGLKKCSACRKQFTVRVGTLFENSHIPLHKWLQATYLLCCSKKRISARQLHRVLDVSYKSAWFMTRRIRLAMRSGGPAGDWQRERQGRGRQNLHWPQTRLGSRDGRRRAYAHKHAVTPLVERRCSPLRLG